MSPANQRLLRDNRFSVWTEGELSELVMKSFMHDGKIEYMNLKG